MNKNDFFIMDIVKDPLYKFFKSGRIFKRDKANIEGYKEVINTHTNTDYKVVYYKNKSLLAHRIIFYNFTNILPPVVDHVDNNRANNDIDNLRAATYALNRVNRKPFIGGL